MTLLAIIIPLFFVFITRSLPYFIFGPRSLTTGDATVHLILIDLLREGTDKGLDLSNKFLLSDQETYPVLFHKLLARFPKTFIDRYEGLIGTVIETAHALVIFWAGFIFAQYYFPEIKPLTGALITTLMFGMSPLLINNRGRVFRLSPRPFAALLATISLTCMAIHLISGSILAFILGSFFFGLVGLSSKFGVQALVSICLGMSLINLDFRPLLFILMGFAFALILSKGDYWNVLKGHVNHSRFYQSYLAPRYLRHEINGLARLIELPRIFFHSFRGFINVLLSNFVLISFTLFPWTMLLILSYFLLPRVVGGLAERVLASWCIAASIAMVATSTKQLQFLGESYRYVIYAVFPVCLLTTYRLSVIGGFPLIAWMIIFSGISVVGFVWVYSRTYKRLQMEPDLTMLYKWMSRQTKSTLLTIDLRLSYPLCFRTPHSAVHVFGNVSSWDIRQEFQELLSKWYPFPRLDFEEIIDKYEVDLLVVDTYRIKEIMQHDPTYVYDFSGLDKVYKDYRYEIYDARQS